MDNDQLSGVAQGSEFESAEGKKGRCRVMMKMWKLSHTVTVVRDRLYIIL